MLISCAEENDPGSQIYYISFDTNGGEGTFHRVPTLGNATFSMPALAPKRDGYVFDGWFFDLDRWERQLTATSLLLDPIYANCTVYAKWTFNTPSEPIVVDPTPPTLNFELQLISDGHQNVVRHISKAAIEEQDVNIFSKEGYLLEGWYLDSKFQGSSVSFPFDNGGVSGSVTLYAKWEIITYTVSYTIPNPNVTILQNIPDQQRSIGEVFVLPDLTTSQAYYVNYVFSGWITSSNDTVLKAGSQYVFTEVPTANRITFIASWTRTYTASFAKKPEDNVLGNLPSSISRTAGSEYSLPVIDQINFSYTSHRFIGWYDGVSLYKPTTANPVTLTMDTNNIVYYATWEPLFGVQYLLATGLSGSIPDATYAAGESFILPSATNLALPGYEFICWQYNETNYFGLQSFVMPAYSLIFTAYVKEKDTYTVKFDANNGTGDTPTVSNKIENESFIIPDNPSTFTRTYYAFDHWSYSIGQETYIVYTGGTVVMPAENLTLVAVWRALDYVVTYDYGTTPTLYSPIVNNNPTTYNADLTQDISIEKIACEGYLFAGWYEDSARTKLIDDPSLDVTTPKSVTFYAKFEFIKYKVNLNDGLTDNGYYIANSDFILIDSKQKYFVIKYGDYISDIIASISLTHPLYIIAYWDFNGSVYAPTTRWANDGDISLTAVWTEPGSEGLAFLVNSDGKSMRVKAYNGSESKVVIPSYYNSLPVTTIDINAFKDNTIVTELVIPSTIKEISSSAFENSVISELTLGDGIEVIAPDAFKNALSLKRVYASTNTKISTIGSNAFYGCTSLEYVFLPASVLTIGQNAFANTSEKLRIYMSGMGTQSGFASDWADLDNVVWNVRLDTSNLVYTFSNKTVVIVGYIGDSTEVIIPKKIQSLDVSGIFSYAFANNQSLKSVTVNSQVSVDSYAFENCLSLYAVIFNSAPTSIDKTAFYNSINTVVYVIGNYIGENPHNFFYNGIASLSDIVIVQDVYLLSLNSSCYLTKYLGDATDFHTNDSALTSYQIAYIGDGSFAGSQITNLYLYQDINIGANLFYGTKNNVVLNLMTTVDFEKWNSKWNITKNSATVTINFPTGGTWTYSNDGSLALEYYEKDNQIYITNYYGTNHDFSISSELISNKTIKGIVGTFNSKNLEYIFIDAGISIIDSFMSNPELVVVASTPAQGSYFSSIGVNYYQSSVQPTRTILDNVNYYTYTNGTTSLVRAVTSSTTITVPTNLGINNVSDFAFNTSTLMRITFLPEHPVQIKTKAFSSNPGLIIYYSNDLNFTDNVHPNAYIQSTLNVSDNSYYYTDSNNDVVLVDFTGSGIVSLPNNITIIKSGTFTRGQSISNITVPWTVHTFPQSAVNSNVPIYVYSTSNPGWEISNPLYKKEDLSYSSTTEFTYFVENSKAYIVGASSNNINNKNGILTIPTTFSGNTVAGILDPFALNANGLVKFLYVTPASGYFIGLLNSLSPDAVVIFAGPNQNYSLYDSNPSTTNLFFGLTLKTDQPDDDGNTLTGYYDNSNNLIVLSSLTVNADSYKYVLPSTLKFILQNALSNTKINILVVPSGCKISAGSFDNAYVGMRIIIEDDLDLDYSQIFPGRIIYDNTKNSEILVFNNFIYIVNQNSIIIIGISTQNLSDVVYIPLSMPLSTNLSGLYVPLTAIDNYAFDAFDGDNDVTVISIPSTITNIYANSFASVSDVELQLQGNVSSDWESNWNNNLAYKTYYGIEKDNFKFYVSNQQAYITSYITTIPMSVTIPVSFDVDGNTYSVVSLGSAFAGSKTLETLIINAQITEFADAIKGCTSLTTIVLPDSVTRIPDYAFANLSALTSVTITYNGQSISIGNYAFANLVKLETLSLPDISALGIYVFSGCKALTSFTSYLPNGIITDGLFSECINLEFNLYGYVEIGAYAFYKNQKFESIDIPNTITSIGAYAFANIPTLLSVNFSTNSYLSSLPSGIFSDSLALREVVLHENITKIDSAAFKNSVNLSNITPFNQVTIIGDSAFDGCTSLTLLNISDDLTYIGARAFFGVYYMGDVKLNSAESIGVAAFAYAGVNSFIIISSPYYSVDNGVLYSNNTLIQYPVLKSSTALLELSDLSAISPYAFAGANSLSRVNISNVPSIGEYAFTTGNSLTIYASYTSKPSGWSDTWADAYVTWLSTQSIYFDNGFSYQLNPDNTLSLINFSGDNKITIPTSFDAKLITSIGDNAFANKNMTWIKIESTITFIASTAFNNNPNLTVWYAGDPAYLTYEKVSSHEFYTGANTLTHNEITSIDDGYTYYYYKTPSNQVVLVKLLTSELYLNLNGVIASELHLYPFVFAGSSLLAISLPNVVGIASTAFSGISHLVVTTASTKSSGWETGYDSNATIHQNTTPTMESDYLQYEDAENLYIIRYLGNDNSIIIQNTQTEKKKIIAPFAFANISSINEITIVDFDISEYAFSNMSRLYAFKLITSSHVNIGSYAFANSSLLHTFVIYDTNNNLSFKNATVQDNIFSDCISLVSITTEHNGTVDWSKFWNRIKMQTSSMPVQVLVKT